MRSILVVSSFFPYPLNNGGNVRLFNLLLSFRDHFAITLVCPRPPRPDDAGVIEGLCARVAYLPDPPDGETPGLRRRLRYGMAGRDLTRLLERIRATALAEDPAGHDLLWVERLILAPALRGFESRTIVDYDDVIHLKYLREARVAASPALRARALERSARWFVKETMGGRRFLATVVCSDEDKRHLERFGLTNVRVVPNGADIPPRRPSAEPRPPGPPRPLFIGNMVYPPNRDALDFYTKEIAPLLQERFPGLLLDAVGPGADAELTARHAQAVRFLGFVGDLGAAIAAYDLLLVPLREGGGTKLKVLDAMANGLPVVTTPVGAEGLHLEHRRSALIGRGAAELAQHVEEIHRDPGLADALADAAYDVASGDFRWEVIRRRLAGWVAEAASAAGSAKAGRARTDRAGGPAAS